MREFGQHLTIDASLCNRKKLVSQTFVYDILNNLPAKLNMTKMTLPYVAKWKDKWAKTEGISGFVMIAESHIAIHTFPEGNSFWLDVFSCKKFDKKKVINIVKKELEVKKIKAKFLIR